MDDVQGQPSSLRLFDDASVSESAGSITQKTFIVFGVPRGGTTMVARVVEKLGVVMGTKLPLNYEDDEFNYDKMSDEIKQDPEQMARGLMRAINRRNNRFDIWGWKYPRAHLYLPKIIKHVRNHTDLCLQGPCGIGIATPVPSPITEEVITIDANQGCEAALGLANQKYSVDSQAQPAVFCAVTKSRLLIQPRLLPSWHRLLVLLLMLSASTRLSSRSIQAATCSPDQRSVSGRRAFDPSSASIRNAGCSLLCRRWRQCGD